MSGYQIECIAVSKQYTGNRQKVTAVDNVSLGIRKSEIAIIKGRSGAGKSTLLNLMSGLIKPTSGKVMIENNCISELSNNALSWLLLNRIGIIFQNFNLLPTYTIYENIEIALAPEVMKQGRSKKSIMALLEQFELNEKEYLLPAELSAGQQQKVAIIRTLIKEPSIIFADEPTGSVDDKTAEEILTYLVNFKKERNITLVIATHGDMPEKFADRIFNIENGRIEDSTDNQAII